MHCNVEDDADVASVARAVRAKLILYVTCALTEIKQGMNICV